MKPRVSHDWSEETPEAKARWFQSLSMTERADMLCAFTELALALNPRIADARRDQPVSCVRDSPRKRRGLRVGSARPNEFGRGTPCTSMAPGDHARAKLRCGRVRLLELSADEEPS